MKKYAAAIVSVLVVLGFVLYFILNGQNSATVAGTPAGTTADLTGNQTAATPTGTPPADQGSQTAANPPAQTPPASGTGTKTSTGQYKDGTYTGPIVDAVYGQIQVVATIQGGKLVDTNCPVYPMDGGHTIQVSRTALPQLKQEAIASQSANVDIVSGATQTSQGYQQSLAAALAQAKS